MAAMRARRPASLRLGPQHPALDGQQRQLEKEPVGPPDIRARPTGHETARVRESVSGVATQGGRSMNASARIPPFVFCKAKPQSCRRHMSAPSEKYDNLKKDLNVSIFHRWSRLPQAVRWHRWHCRARLHDSDQVRTVSTVTADGRDYAVRIRRAPVFHNKGYTDLRTPGPRISWHRTATCGGQANTETSEKNGPTHGKDHSAFRFSAVPTLTMSETTSGARARNQLRIICIKIDPGTWDTKGFKSRISLSGRTLTTGSTVCRPRNIPGQQERLANSEYAAHNWRSMVQGPVFREECRESATTAQRSERPHP